MRSQRPKRRKRKSEGTPLHLVLDAAPLMPGGSREGRWDPGAWVVEGGKRAGEEEPAGCGEVGVFGGNHPHLSLSVPLSQTAHAHRI